MPSLPLPSVPLSVLLHRLGTRRVVRRLPSEGFEAYQSRHHLAGFFAASRWGVDASASCIPSSLRAIAFPLYILVYLQLTFLLAQRSICSRAIFVRPDRFHFPPKHSICSYGGLPCSTSFSFAVFTFWVFHHFQSSAFSTGVFAVLTFWVFHHFQSSAFSTGVFRVVFQVFPLGTR